MVRRLRLFRVVLLLTFCSLCGPALRAEGFFQTLEYSARASILAIPEDNGLESDPMPILAVPGIAASYPLRGLFSLEASLDMYGTYYGYSDGLDRAVPYAIENRSAFVLGSIVGFQGVLNVSLPRQAGLRVYAGPAADLRLCLAAGGLEGEDLEDVSEQTERIATYFWSKGRWFYPMIGIGVDRRTFDKVRMGIDLRGWVPLYRYWTGEDLPAVEGWRAAVGLRFTFL